MADERREGLILVLLHVQFAISVAVLLLVPLGGRILALFSQLPGALLETTSATNGGETAYPVLFHLLATAALGGLLWAIHRNDGRLRPWMAGYLLASIAALPFGAVLAYHAWRISDEGDWDDALHYASGVGRRSYALVGGAWLGITVVAGLMTMGAFVGLMGGATLAALALLAAAFVVQWGGIRGVELWQARSKMRTFGSPLPELPGF